LQNSVTRIGSRAVIFMDQVPDTYRGYVDAGFQKIFDTVAAPECPATLSAGSQTVWPTCQIFALHNCRIYRRR
jgi:hypothetical protein